MKISKTQVAIYLWFPLMILCYLLFSYYYFGKWWNSSVGTLLILFFSYLIWKKNFLKETGLNVNLGIVLKTILVGVTVIAMAYLLQKYLAGKGNVIIKYTNWRNYYHDIFYILNEEIMLGAIILFGILKKNFIKPIYASLSLAILFSFVHFVFYKWIFDQQGVIQFTALSTLFLVGFVRNMLIITTGHIGYSWALHFGWIAVMFGCKHTYSNTLYKLSEPERINIYLGSMEILVISLILAIITSIFWYKYYLPKK